MEVYLRLHDEVEEEVAGGQVPGKAGGGLSLPLEGEWDGLNHGDLIGEGLLVLNPLDL